MLDKRSPFFAYRYLVTPISEQITIIQQLNKSKEELMTEIIKDLSVNVKTEWSRGNKRFLFYYTFKIFTYNKYKRNNG